MFLAGVSAKRIKDLNGCSAKALRDAGYGAKSLVDADLPRNNCWQLGLPNTTRECRFKPAAIIASGRTADCSVDSLKKREPQEFRFDYQQTLGCSAQA